MPNRALFGPPVARPASSGGLLGRPNLPGLGFGAASSGGGLLGRPNPLLYAGLGLLSQGPSLTPISPWQGLGAGLGMYAQAARDYRADERAAAELAMREQEFAAREQARVDEQQREAEARQREMDRQQQVAALTRQHGGDLSALGTGLLAIPGYEQQGASLLGRAEQSGLAREGLDIRREALEETVRHNQAAEAAAAAKPPPGAWGAEDIRSTRNQYEQATRKDREAVKAYQSVQQLANTEQPTAASDTALIFQFMKTLDPTSTVREGEQASVQNAGNIPTRIRNLYNSAFNGTRLEGPQREEIRAAAYTAVQPRLASLEALNNTYTGIAQRAGVPASDIVIHSVPGGLEIGRPAGPAAGEGQPKLTVQVQPEAAPTPAQPAEEPVKDLTQDPFFSGGAIQAPAPPRQPLSIWDF